MARGLASRKWQLTFNNPTEHKYSHVEIKTILDTFAGCVYWCLCDEVGEQGTYHSHLFMAFKNAVMFETIRKKFDGAHCEIANGTSQQNRDYVRKEGKWLKDKKHETNLSEMFEEWGDMPVERQGARNDLADLYDMIKSGMSNYEIIDECPQYMMNIDKIERSRQIIRENNYKSTFRNIEVTYIFGKTGSGKTRTVMEQYGYENVYRVTDYVHPFDGYSGEKVVIFEEFCSSLKIREMLTYLDGYPISLPCRYANKVACFTKVYLLTNVALEGQYRDVQQDYPETWNAFKRRIDKVKEYSDTGISEYPSVDDYLKSLENNHTIVEWYNQPLAGVL